MGFGGISIWQLLIILVIVVLIFGTKKLRGMGGDLGSAIKGFKKAVKEDDGAKKEEDATAETDETENNILQADPLSDDSNTTGEKPTEESGEAVEKEKEKRQA